MEALGQVHEQQIPVYPNQPTEKSRPRFP
jgi:hypothetical protein